MDMVGERRVAAPRQVVWDALNDPEVLKHCIPGCEDITRSSPTEMTAKARVKVGPMSARFSGKVSLSDLDPPHGYRISGEGQGGAAGFAKGGADVRLQEDEDGTTLSYAVQAQVGGKLAQIGARLIDATAKSLADQFFARFAEHVGAPPPEELVAAQGEEAVAARRGMMARVKGMFGGRTVTEPASGNDSLDAT